jgi:hypothetical protein
VIFFSIGKCNLEVLFVGHGDIPLVACYYFTYILLLDVFHDCELTFHCVLNPMCLITSDVFI